MIVIEIAAGIILAVLFFVFLPYIVLAFSAAAVVALAVAAIVLLIALAMHLSTVIPQMSPEDWASLVTSLAIIAVLVGAISWARAVCQAERAERLGKRGDDGTSG
jgi:hypothetical protein